MRADCVCVWGGEGGLAPWGGHHCNLQQAEQIKSWLMQRVKSVRPSVSDGAAADGETVLLRVQRCFICQ